ncbi:TIGR03503 family protein [Alkalimonas delamerensis]|uniref:TIGR03503 family protein n=1 Tax=Alkalimonas delamerensis TaxID=265981 RepID=A0ABT9GLX6_9GAMM|nr:TIGR03503 family protein [Alkalimonas delamerensis]MDP4527975.1 TIGR03503 family protein [Alkalimonas delamerensis]
MVRRLLTLWLLCCAVVAAAEPVHEDALSPEELAQLEQMDLSFSELLADTPFDVGFEMLEQLPTQNQVALFDNRFRIDGEVDEITLLMFRRPGSPSVILVRPDGSKINFRNAEEQQVVWHSSRQYDLIQIPTPMPGPWQALGRILPESRIMVLSDILLDVDPLPEHVMSGETLKVTARLQNAGEPINARDFREILTLDVIFISANNPEHDNFGRGIVEVAQFRDDGRGLDERARDGIFTGEFKLDFAAGEWIPKYLVKTPLYTREVEQKPVMVHPLPVQLRVEQAEQPEGTHRVHFEVTDPQIRSESLIFQGRARYPDGDVLEFTVLAQEHGFDLPLEHRGFGSYVVEVQAFGELHSGREFMLTLPNLSFSVNIETFQAPELERLPEEILAEEAARLQQEEPASFPWGWVIAANLLILSVGGFVIWLMMSGKSWRDLLPKKKAASDKTAKKESKAVEPTNKTAGKKDDLDDILDLSLPDD